MKKISFLLLLSILLPMLSLLPASAAESYTVSVTDGKSGALTDPSVRNYWKPASADSKATVTLKKGVVADGIYISWYAPDSEFVLTAFDGEGKVVTRYENGDRYDGYSCFYPLDETARKVEIAMPSKGDNYGIVYLELSEKGKDNPNLMKWKDPAQSCDLLVVPTHQDDEYIFLGGVIPKYLDAGYSVCLAYTSVCARLRVEEGLKGIWTTGIRNYPDFIGYQDMGRKDTFNEAAEAWGGLDAVVKSYVRELRMRKPVVVVTHDENGENYHNSHKVTAAALKQAAVSAADPTYDPESAERYGVWQVSKLYLHLYKKNQIHLNYSTPLQNYGGKTAYDVAIDAYDCHESQHEWYMLDWKHIQPGAKYDNRLFGCYFSAVGYDNVDLFYNTPIYRGGTNIPETPSEPPATSADSPTTSSEPMKTNPPATSSEPMKTNPPVTSSEPIKTNSPTTPSETAKTDPPKTTSTSPVSEPPKETSGPSVTSDVTTSGLIPFEQNRDSRPILPILLGFGIAAAAAIAGAVIALVLRRRRM